MKKLVHILLGLSLILISLTSCSENDLFGQGEGTLALRINMQSNLPIISTRSTITDEELLQRCKVYIRNSEGLVRKFATLDEMPDRLQLVANNYKAEVTAGDSVPASFTDSYYKGVKDFTIVSGHTISETIKCGIQNTVVSLKLSDELKEAFPSCKITVSNRKGKLEYTPENIAQLGYFMLLSDENQLRWNFEGVVGGGEGNKIQKSGIINLVKRATKYELTFSNPAAEVGGGIISVTVDETALSSDLNVELLARPVIKVIEGDKVFELDNPVYRAVGDKDTPIMVRMAASKPFTEIQISSTDFVRLGIETFSSFDLMGLTDTQLRELHDFGFSIEFNDDVTQVQFSFSENLRKTMTDTKEPGKNTYNFDIAVKDQNGKSRAKALTVVTTGALVATESIPNEEDVWGTRATLYGSLVIPTAADLKFRYRATDGDTSWKNSENATVNGKIFKSIIRGLKPNVKYEYQAMSGTVSAEESRFFTTEEPVQLPNAGFEDWNGSSPLYIYKSGDNMFWDSGNTGSATLKKNVTTNDSGIKHSGNYSAKLQSQHVAFLGIGAFAAGNIFVGRFLKVDGTDGILRFGRAFTSRPAKLKLYYKYVSGTVDYSTYGLSTGSKDIGIVYVALGDWPHQSAEGESDIPVLVKTKAEYRQLFDSNSSNVIGYGEYQMEASTEGDGMLELTVPIVYRSDRKPTDIVVVGSASKYGDYFTGSTGSTLWLDDMELIYEDVVFEK